MLGIGYLSLMAKFALGYNPTLRFKIVYYPNAITFAVSIIMLIALRL